VGTVPDVTAAIVPADAAAKKFRLDKFLLFIVGSLQFQ